MPVHSLHVGTEGYVNSPLSVAQSGYLRIQEGGSSAPGTTTGFEDPRNYTQQPQKAEAEIQIDAVSMLTPDNEDDLVFAVLALMEVI